MWVFSVSADVCGMPVLMCDDTVLGTIFKKVSLFMEAFYAP